MAEDGGGRTPLERPTSQLTPLTKKNNNTIVAWKGPAQGNVVSRNSTAKHKLSDFFPVDTKSTYKNGNETIDNVMQGREQILSILNDAGIVVDNPSEMRRLPRWQQVTELYGPKPVILGLDQCQSFQDRVPPQNRFLGVAGNFNSGTTAFGISLQANCRFPHHNDTMSRLFSNEKVSNVNGMLNQVPWAKHKMAFNKYNHTILSTVPKDHVLPVVLVRDPFYWMQSMCKEGYGVRWDHDSQKHCPNLIPNEFDKKRFGKRLARTNVTSVRVWMGANPTVGPSWDSLVHYWNAWYESYVDATWPRLLIRFEDTLFHPKQVMEEVCRCGGGELVKPFRYLVDEAKWNHKQEQNNMVTAILRYGTARGRYHNMTKDDIAFSDRILNSTLLDVFQYQAPYIHS
ncbi:hypothetical protein IV203_017243 [Nitzschia inconspicua]|uniref:Sulfotransferase domain-containing protein n=1 Tax=Nitzschia inconspicua TaxID=303405 RepID=A0A9K3PIF2_9STRA|nr:hypothetical protein IV203_017243 [Nitzschia inconspicua]